MEILHSVLKLFHILGVSTLFGGILSQTFEEERRVLKITKIGGAVTVLGGVGLYLQVGLSEGWDHINTLPFFIKMGLVSMSVLLAYVGGEKMSKKVFIAHIVLLVSIIGVAVLFL